MISIFNDTRSMWRALQSALCAAMVVFLIAPMAIVVVISFSSAPFLMFPPPGFSLQWYDKVFSLPVWADSLSTSFRIMIPSSILSTLLGTAAAFGLARGRFRGKGLISALILAPLVVPIIITAAALLGAYRAWGLLGTHTGLILAHAAMSVPYVVFTVLGALKLVDPRLEDAALTLGATRWQSFHRITLPLIMPAVLSGLLFSMVMSFDELIISIFISSPTVRPVTVQMWSDVRGDVDPTIAAIGTLILSFSLLVLLIEALLRRSRRSMNGSSRSPAA
jgi:putative spermidine/putrescine transport system permease protein